MGLAGKRPPKSTLQILEDYFNITSCHALGNIVNDGVVGNPLGRRIFWGLFWIIAFIYLSLFTVEQFTVFFDFPTTTAIDFANGDFVQFPAVSFCSSNPISFSDVKYGPNNTTFSETSLTLTQTSFEHLEKWGYRWDDILLEARRPDGSLINGSSLEPYLDDNYGNCWTIKDMGSVSFPGTSEAAQFTFNVRPIDYMQDIKQTAVVMTVHDPKAKPFMPAGFTARAGDSTTVQIRQILLTRLPDPYSKCWCREGVDNPKHGTCKTTKPADYNINSCKRSCVFQRAKLRCGCAPGFMDGVPVHCMNCSSDPTVACESRDCLRKILDDIGTNADPCACKQACTELGYDISVSHATYPNLVDPAVMSRANNDCWDKIAVQLNNDPLFAARCYVDTTLEAVLDETVTGLAPCPLTVSDIETIAADHMTRVIDNNPSAPASGLVADMVAYKGLLQVIELMVAGGFDTLDPFTVSQCGVKPVSSERWVQEPSQTYVRAAWDYERSVKARVLVYFSEFTTETVTWEASMLPMGLLSGVGGTFGLFLGISFATLAEFIELIGIVLLDVIGLTKICQPQCGRGSVAPDNKASDKSAGDVEMAETTTTPSAPPIVLVSNDQAA